MLNTTKAGSLISGKVAGSKGKPMKTIEIKRQTFIRGELAEVGDIVEVSEADAEFLITISKAVAAKKKPVAVKKQSKPAVAAGKKKNL